MVNEKPVTDKALDRAHSIDLPWTGRANDGAGAQSLVDEFARLGHDQVGLQRLWLTLCQVFKRNGGPRDGVHVGQGKRIACLVLPSLKVHDLRSADADEDAQNFQAGYPLNESSVEAGAGLLDKRKVKSSGEGDRLEVGGDAGRGVTHVTASRVGIASRNCRMLPRIQTRDCLIERRAEIGVGRAAVPNPPTGVHRELGEVGEPSDLPGSVRGAAR